MAKYKLSDIFKGNFPITQKYGENPANYPMFLIPGHEGTDYGTPNGTEVLAPFDGIILRDTQNDKDYGNFTVIWDPIQHCGVWYCHLQDVTTGTGDKVTNGQIVGHTNNTGHSTGPHLHVNFVETDASGNRLNMDNGKQGFLNILDPNLVEWKSSANQAQPLPQEYSKQQAIIDTYVGILGLIPSQDELSARLEQVKNGKLMHDIVSEILNLDSRSPLVILKQINETLTKQYQDAQHEVDNLNKQIIDLQGQIVQFKNINTTLTQKMRNMEATTVFTPSNSAPVTSNSRVGRAISLLSQGISVLLGKK